MDNSQTSRGVWVLARPLSWSLRLLPLPSQTSDGVFPLCHWGILVTHLPEQMVKDIVADSRAKRGYGAVNLGQLLELNRIEHRSTLNLTEEFSSASFGHAWSVVSAQYVGETRMQKAEIWAEDTPLLRSSLIPPARIIRDNPQYDLFTANCQNFAQYLVHSICLPPCTLCPRTIRDTLTRPFPPPPRNAAGGPIPGTYPQSGVSIRTESFETAKSHYSVSIGQGWVAVTTVDPQSGGSDDPELLRDKMRKYFESFGAVDHAASDGMSDEISGSKWNDGDGDDALGNVDSLRPSPRYIGIKNRNSLSHLSVALQTIFLLPALRKV